jgi:hypothetical protein
MIFQAIFGDDLPARRPSWRKTRFFPATRAAIVNPTDFPGSLKKLKMLYESFLVTASYLA